MSDERLNDVENTDMKKGGECACEDPSQSSFDVALEPDVVQDRHESSSDI